jgi:hypothetical protein
MKICVICAVVFSVIIVLASLTHSKPERDIESVIGRIHYSPRLLIETPDLRFGIAEFSIQRPSNMRTYETQFYFGPITHFLSVPFRALVAASLVAMSVAGVAFLLWSAGAKQSRHYEPLDC